MNRIRKRPVSTHVLAICCALPHLLASDQGNGKHAVVLAISEVRGIVERACARHDVLDACAGRDLGTVITVLGAHGLTQGQIADLTGIPQGRLSEYVCRKREPKGAKTFEDFANGLDLPLAARRALGLAAEPSGSAGISLAHSQAPDLDAGLEYPGTPAQAAGNVSMLWRAEAPRVSRTGLLQEEVPHQFGIHGVLEEQHHVMTRIHEEVSARMPHPGESRLLQLRPGVPVIDVWHTSIDQDGEPYELTRFVMRGDMTGLVYDVPVE